MIELQCTCGYKPSRYDILQPLIDGISVPYKVICPICEEYFIIKDFDITISSPIKQEK